ncbi:hypothetical protein FRB90_000339, partial [Tulasnella sp. 427]
MSVSDTQCAQKQCLLEDRKPPRSNAADLHSPNDGEAETRTTRKKSTAGWTMKTLNRKMVMKPARCKPVLGPNLKRTEGEIKRKANDLVRMALFEEPRRQTLKRADIIKKVIPDNSRGFGMVLITRSRSFVPPLAWNSSNSGRARIGMLSGRRSKKPERREAKARERTSFAAHWNPTSSEPRTKSTTGSTKRKSRVSVLFVSSEMSKKGEISSVRAALILAWRSVEPVALTGILHLVLCLILANGRLLPEPQLKRQLKSFHLYFNSTLPSPTYSSQDEKTLFEHLSDMIKQSYLDRVRVQVPGGTTVQGGTRRKSRKAADEDEEGLFEWRWGSRAHAEIGEQNVAEFICEFMQRTWLDEQK